MSSTRIRLGILDQSPVRKGSTAEEAIKETVQLAVLADQLGFTRFWVSEHHNTTSLAGSTPEVLIAHLAGKTNRIRVGSGGVMMPNHSALKVAENFRMLEAIFPGRIDLGMGRAPGTDRLTAAVLNPSNQFREQDFVQQLSDLQHYFHDTGDNGTIQAKVKATPKAQTVPEQWLLSSSGQSAIFAAHFGLGFSFAHFINPVGGPAAAEMYRQRFNPVNELAEPAVNFAIFVFCSRDEEKIIKQQAIIDYRLIQFERGKFDPVDVSEVEDAVYTDNELQRIAFNRQRVILGTPAEVKEQLTRLANDYKADEIIAANITLDFEDRINSYKLLAEVFEL
jgi:luciferase family oxidoreductase group 1